ncbi:lamin tail domain-containing protein [Myroides sp. DW712]|uniref:lamin tail domain-containing protein n=1 Tax=Myroides sp. DW712 TaxID=3389800 RepID=UPI00397C379B
MKKLYILFFVLLGITSCVKDEVFEGPAVIESVTYAPQEVTSTDEVTVTAKIVDLKGIQSATLTYSIENKNVEVAMKAGENNTFTGIIPAQPNKTKVELSVTAINQFNLTTTAKKQSYKVSDVIVDYSIIRLNEIDANSKSIELFNAGTEPFSLEGFKLVKNNDGDWWVGSAASGTIAPGEYVVIIQKNPDNPELSGSSGISAKQALKFELFAPSGKSIGLFLRGSEDELGKSISDTAPNSYQIIPNATGKWKLAPPTIGQANATTGEEIPNK